MQETKASTTVSSGLVACFMFSYQVTASAYTVCWVTFLWLDRQMEKFFYAFRMNYAKLHCEMKHQNYDSSR